jgi:hypothetical protein
VKKLLKIKYLFLLPNPATFKKAAEDLFSEAGFDSGMQG